MFKIKSNKIYLYLMFIISMLIVIIDNKTIGMVVVIITMICSLFLLRIHQLIFALFLIASVAWGASINLTLRMGNIMPSDIALAILAISMFFAMLNGKLNLKYTISKKINVMLLLLILMYLLFGLIKGYEVNNILQDFKLFLYIYVPFLYLSTVDFDQFFIDILLLVAQIYLCTVFLQEIIHFKGVGLNQLVNNGFGQRDVSIIVQFIPLVASILFVERNRVGVIRVLVLQVMACLGCLLSFTRTIWIAYILAFIILVLFASKRPLKIIRNATVTCLVLCLIYIAAINIIPNLFYEYFNAVIARITDSTNQTNTLDYRLEFAGMVFQDKILRIDTIFGSGFGEEIWDRVGSVFIENSLLYYLWKYGIIVTSLFVAKILINIWKAFKFNGVLIRIISLNLLSFICLSNFSGNLNLYYCVPVLSFVFAYTNIKRKFIKKEKLIVG